MSGCKLANGVWKAFDIKNHLPIMTFFFALKIRPSIHHPEYVQVTKGCAFVFVVDENIENAASRAIEKARGDLWEIIETEAAGEIDESGCTTEEQRELFAGAKKFGISCAYLLDRPGGNPGRN